MNTEAILRLWRGEHDLHDTFWRYVIVIGLIVNMTSSIAFIALITNEMPIAALFVGYVLTIPYNVFVLVAVWRSANAYQGMKTTAEFMRIVSLAWLALLTLT